MGVLNTDDLIFPGIVTLMSCYQLAMFAQKVGEQRRKHKINPPSIEGPPEFVRAFRAQQNSLEMFPVYMGTLWTSAIFFHPIPVSVVGLGYMQARATYFTAYVKDAEARVPPFKRSITCLKIFLAMAAMGLTQAAVKNYAGIDLKELVGVEKLVKMIKM